MIILVVGDIGSGKTATLVRNIMIKLMQGQAIYTNFTLSSLPKHLQKNFYQLKFEQLTDFKFWKKQFGQGFSIVLDEFHNIADSRRAVSKRNITITQWLAQIRKILKGHSNNHLFISTQYLRQIDVRTRDLAQYMIECEFRKGRSIEQDLILNFHYTKSNSGDFVFRKKTYFYPFNVYKYFDTHELIDFGKKEDYVG